MYNKDHKTFHHHFLNSLILFISLIRFVLIQGYRIAHKGPMSESPFNFQQSNRQINNKILKFPTLFPSKLTKFPRILQNNFTVIKNLKEILKRGCDFVINTVVLPFLFQQAATRETITSERSSHGAQNILKFSEVGVGVDEHKSRKTSSLKPRPEEMTYVVLPNCPNEKTQTHQRLNRKQNTVGIWRVRPFK